MPACKAVLQTLASSLHNGATAFAARNGVTGTGSSCSSSSRFYLHLQEMANQSKPAIGDPFAQDVDVGLEKAPKLGTGSAKSLNADQISSSCEMFSAWGAPGDRSRATRPGIRERSPLLSASCSARVSAAAILVPDLAYDIGVTRVRRSITDAADANQRAIG